jgi:hypothetical protein
MMEGVNSTMIYYKNFCECAINKAIIYIYIYIYIHIYNRK